MGEKISNKISVLFVCLGNICRSPMAEGALREAARKAGLELEVDSVGTAGYHIGEPPDPRAVAVARDHGVSISGLIGRQLADADFDRFTHIFALDSANLAGIRARAPRHCEARIGLLLDVLDHRKGESVADPYYGDEQGFEDCWQTISEAVDALLASFAAGSSGLEPDLCKDA
jgi:protein-tyrosine phosphatase